MQPPAAAVRRPDRCHRLAGCPPEQRSLEVSQPFGWSSGAHVSTRGVDGELEDPGQNEGSEIGQEADRRECEGGRAAPPRRHAQHCEVRRGRPRQHRPHDRAEVADGCLLHLDVGLGNETLAGPARGDPLSRRAPPWTAPPAAGPRTGRSYELRSCPCSPSGRVGHQTGGSPTAMAWVGTAPGSRRDVPGELALDLDHLDLLVVESGHRLG